MNSEPLITIVVPVYKVPEKLLNKCLNSIVLQTSNNFEAILIDDGSPDDCGKICDEYASKYSCFKVIHQKNKGLSVVRNNGIKNANGSWVCFVDGDDWIEPETVAFVEKYIGECEDGDVLIWDEFYDIGDTVKKNLFVKGCDDEKLHQFDRTNMQTLVDMFFPIVYENFTQNFVDIGTANARVYRKDFLINNQLFNIPGLKRMQDNVFNLWVFDYAECVYYCSKRLYHYTYNDEAVTQKYSPQIVDTMNTLYSCMKDFVIKRHDDYEYHQRLYSRFMRIFGEIFKLNYANPQNSNRLSTKIKNTREDFSSENFKEVVDNFDTSMQGTKTKTIHFMLKHKMYLFLIVYYSLSIRTRKMRMVLRSQ